MLDPATVFDGSGPLEDPLTDEVLRSVEAQLGHQLPNAYVDLARRHNGGPLARDAHPAPNRTSWAADHVGVYTLAAIGRTARFSLCGEFGSAFWVAKWGYPDIGIYIADCPSAGHDMVALDYRSPGKPAVVHVDQEWNYQITVLIRDRDAKFTRPFDEVFAGEGVDVRHGHYGAARRCAASSTTVPITCLARGSVFACTLNLVAMSSRANNAIHT